MTKRLLISDGHFSLKVCPTEMEIILRSVLKVTGEQTALGEWISRHYEWQKAAHITAALEQSCANAPYDGLISLGDSLSGWNNVGLDLDDDDTKEALRYKDILVKKLGLTPDRQVWVPGNHDLGYYNCSFSSQGSDWPQANNFSSFAELYGPTYGSINLSAELSFIWLSTAHVETLNVKADKTADTKLDFLIKQQREELDFLSTALDQLSGKFILGIHDPGSFLSPQLQAILNPHLPQLVASFTGHLHAEWLLQFFKLVRPNFRSVMNKYRIQFIPSIWGVVLPFFFWPTGAGYAELEIAGPSAHLHLHTIGIKKIKTIFLC